MRGDFFDIVVGYMGLRECFAKNGSGGHNVGTSTDEMAAWRELCIWRSEKATRAGFYVGVRPSFCGLGEALQSAINVYRGIAHDLGSLALECTSWMTKMSERAKWTGDLLHCAFTPLNAHHLSKSPADIWR